MTIEQHNRGQVRYYASADQPTIQLTDSPYAVRHVQKLLAIGGIKEGEKVLEVGAGVGRFTRLLKERGIDVTASDISPELITVMQEQLPGVDSFVSDVMQLPGHREESFDAVVGFFMLHHLPDLEEAFRSIAGMLKPGGKVIFCEPNAWFFPFYLQILLTPRMRWSVDKGVKDMRQSILTPALHNAGFRNVNYEYYGFLPPQIYNLSAGKRLDVLMEKLPLPGRVHAFQIIVAEYGD